MRAPLSAHRRSAALSLFRVGLGVALGAGLGGCIVAPVQPRYGAPGYDDDDAGMPPPAPRYEVIGVAPHPGWFWIGGFWTWHSRRHHWVGGHWSAPRPGYRWQPHRWEPISSGRGWREHRGQWVR